VVRIHPPLSRLTCAAAGRHLCRRIWPDGTIKGEPGQGLTLKVRGWVNVEKLVLEAAKQP
jgi:hypothetical protein